MSAALDLSYHLSISMQILKILIGFLALGLAWSLLFKTGIIFKINTWIKENIFNDQVVLYSRRRLALLLFFLGIVSLFSGVEKVVRAPEIGGDRIDQMIVEAKLNLKNRDYQRVLKICRVLIKSNPKNIQVREMEVSALWALGQKKEAHHVVMILQALDPSNAVAKKIDAKISEKNTAPRK